jgi:hypothetical protein
MLQCSMDANNRLRLALEDVLAELWYARRNDDLGRLTALVHLELRRWARVAGEELLGQRSQELVLGCPHSNRQELVSQIDRLIGQAEAVHKRLGTTSRMPPAGRLKPAPAFEVEQASANS